MKTLGRIVETASVLITAPFITAYGVLRLLCGTALIYANRLLDIWK